jgi:hypothetical protein
MNQPNFFQSGSFIGNVIIFEHPASVYAYAPNLDIYRISDKRFFDMALYTNLKSFMAIFNANFENALQSGKAVFTLGYNHLMAQVIKVCLEKYFGDCLFAWKIVSFFHDDADTAKIIYADGQNALNDKSVILLDMLNYPFIQKIEIPYNAVITTEYLADLLS